MKVGDLVIRAYAFREFIPGIIVDEEFYMTEAANDDDEAFAYEEHDVIVAWSDGVVSKEMAVELDYLEEAGPDEAR